MIDSRSHPDPVRILVVDKVAVLRANRLRWRRLSVQADVELTLLAPHRWIENSVNEPFQYPTDTEYRTIVGRVSWPGRELLSIYLSGAVHALRQSRPDVIILMEESFSMFALQFTILRRIFAPRARIIFYSFNIDSYRRFNYRLDRLYRTISRLVMRRAAAALCVNERGAEVLRDSIFSGPIIPLFVGINDEIFHPHDKRLARRSLDIDDGARLFLYAGRLLELKGVEDLILAFARVRQARAGMRLRLMIVGQGEWDANVRACVAESGAADAIDVRSAVPIEQMPQLMAAADAFVLPSRLSWKEQFGRVNAEAMLVGTTIIGSTSGAIPEVIGEGGFIFTAGDIEDLARTMMRVLDEPDECDRRRRIGRATALRAFSVQAFVDGVVDLIEHVTYRTLRRGRS